MSEQGSQNPTEGANEIGERIAAFSVRRPVTLTMLCISLVVMGLVAAGRIPLVMFPDVSFPFLFAQAPYPNSTPEEIQTNITQPLEEVLATVPGVRRLGSSSTSDEGGVEMMFDWGTDIELVRAQVREKIDQIRNDLPEDLRDVYVRNFGSDDIPILEGSISANRDLRSAYDFLDTHLKKPIERLPGVAEVELWGVERQRIDIYLRLDDIKRYHVNVESLFRRLDDANLNMSLGTTEEADQRYAAVFKGAADSVDAIRTFPVNERGLRLEQIAEIDFQNPPRNQGRHLNGRYGVGFSVRKTSEANTVETVDAVMALIDGLEKDPAFAGVSVYLWHNAGDEILESLMGLLEAGAVGSILAVLTLLVFLRRIKLSLVIGISIPFSVISAVGFIYFTGGTLNVLSMMGLMLSTGMLVDNAVVVLESIYQKLEKGFDRTQAAIVGSGEVTTAVTAATLTSIIIFVPLIFGKETNMSVFLGHAGTAIIFALLCSLFISLTIIPIAVARMLDIKVEEQSPTAGRLRAWFEPIALKMGRSLFRGQAPRRGWITNNYIRMVEWPLGRPLLTGLVLIPIMVAVSSWILVKKVPDNTPDAQELGGMDIEYNFSENFHYAKIERDYVHPVEEYLTANKEKFHIKDHMSFYSNNSAQTRVYFDAEDISLDDMTAIRKQLGEGLPVIPGAAIRIGGQQGGNNGNWIGANLFGEDPSELTRIGQDLRRKFLELSHFERIQVGHDDPSEEVQCRLDRSLARRYNISPEAVGQILGIVARARQTRGYRTPEGEVEVWVQLHPDDLQDRNDLESIVVGAGPDGQPIELRQVAHFSLQDTPGRLRREDRQTYTWFQAVYTGEIKEDGRAAFEKVLNDYPFPEGYGWSFGFWTKREQEENQEMVFNLLIALFMVYFVMAALFESVMHPFSIMLSLPFAVVGVAWFLWLTATPFNIMAQIGVMILVGVVVNNGIVLLDHVNNLRRKGLPRHQAVLEGCRERLRPIAMTATTTVVGLIPLAFGDTGLDEMRYFPMARTIMGGLITSTVLTLVVLPTYYVLIDDLGRYVKGLWLTTSSRSAPQPTAVEGD
jgi:HAE1 family hydrophobic/amphiphilic exporter-1